MKIKDDEQYPGFTDEIRRLIALCSDDFRVALGQSLQGKMSVL